MASPKIILYRPDAAPVRSRRIEAKEWDKHRPQLEQLYIKDDKKLEEVMESMELYEGFHASRRQYTQKFNDWGLYKNFYAKVMKSALRKRAQAGGQELSVKFRGTAIAKGNMDRWQRRVPNFNHLSSPTASTPSEIDVQFPSVSPAQQGGLTSPGLVAQSAHLDAFEGSVLDANVIDTAYDEVRRSVSPEVADYIFRTNPKLNIQKTQTSLSWTLDRLLSLPTARANSFMQLTRNNMYYLNKIAANLLIFSADQCSLYCAHIHKIILACLITSDSTSESDRLTAMTRLCIIYTQMGDFDACEELLYDVMKEIISTSSKSPACHEFRSVFGILHARIGQVHWAEALCMNAVMPLRPALGLGHHRTWLVYYRLCLVLDEKGEFQARKCLSKEFFNSFRQKVSSQLLQQFPALLDLCEKYIELWMPESRLQSMAGICWVRENRWDFPKRDIIVLRTVLVKRWKEDVESGASQQTFSDLERSTGDVMEKTLHCVVRMINRKIEAVRRLESDSLRKEAHKAMQILKLTKHLLPLFAFACVHSAQARHKSFDWRTAEQDFIRAMDEVDIEDPPRLASSSLSVDGERLHSTSLTAKSHEARGIDSLNESESVVLVPAAGDRLSPLEYW